MIAETQVLILAATALVFAVVSFGILEKKDYKKGKPPVETFDSIINNLEKYVGKTHPFDFKHISEKPVIGAEHHLSDARYFLEVREVVLKHVQENPGKYDMNPKSSDYTMKVKSLATDLTRKFLEKMKEHHDNRPNT